jgi:hypothetical protein
VNISDVRKLIGDGLSAAGIVDVPIVDPGVPGVPPPAVRLEPDDDELGPGNRTLVHGLRIVVAVPRSGQADQYVRLQSLTAEVLRSLIPSSVSFVGPIRPDSTGGPDTGQPSALVRIIPVTFPGDVDLCP